MCGLPLDRIYLRLCDVCLLFSFVVVCMHSIFWWFSLCAVDVVAGAELLAGKSPLPSPKLQRLFRLSTASFPRSIRVLTTAIRSAEARCSHCTLHSGVVTRSHLVRSPSPHLWLVAMSTTTRSTAVAPLPDTSKSVLTLLASLSPLYFLVQSRCTSFDLAA